MRANKSFARDLSEIAHSLLRAETIKELRKELNDDETDLSKLYNFFKKSGRSLSLKLKKKDFVLSTAFPWANQVLLNNIHTPIHLKTMLELKNLNSQEQFKEI